MKKNILFLQIYGGGGISGGTEVYLKNLLTKLNKKKSIYIATFNKKHTIFSKLGAVEDTLFTRFLENWRTVKLIYRFPLLGLLSYVWGIFWLYRLSAKIILKNRISLIYSNGGLLTAIVAYFLYRTYQIPYILHFHGLFNFKGLIHNSTFSLKSLLFKRIARNALLKASRIIANSKEVADDINGVGGLSAKAEVVHCFVDTGVFYPQNKIQCRTQLHMPLNEFVFLCPNRLDADKGIDFLLESIPQIKTKNIMFTFIGDGILKPQIEYLTKHDKRVVLLPPMKNDVLPKYLNSADIVWGPASVYYIGLSLIEALACGRPIIALNTPLPADNDYGRLVDPKTLPERVGYLIEKNPRNFARLIEALSQKRGILEKKKNDCVDFYNNEYGKRNRRKVLEIIYNLIRQ